MLGRFGYSIGCIHSIKQESYLRASPAAGDNGDVIHPDVALDAGVLLALGGETRGGVEIDFVAGGYLGGILALDLFDGVLVCDDEGDLDEAVVVPDLATGVADLELLRVGGIEKNGGVPPRCGFHAERGERFRATDLFGRSVFTGLRTISTTIKLCAGAGSAAPDPEVALGGGFAAGYRRKVVA